jgi:tetratricopeptide (TPR) repeat protein
MKKILSNTIILFALGLFIFQMARSQDQGYIEKASNAFQNKDYNGAVSLYSKAIENQPKFSPAYYGRGLAYYYLNKLENAIADFVLAVKYDVKFDPAFYGLGLCYTKMGDYKNAIRSFKDGIDLKAEPEYYYALGNAYLYNKDYENSAVSYSSAIKLKPDFGLAYYGRGTAYQYQGNFEEGIKNLEKYIQLQGDKDGLEAEAKRLIQDMRTAKP